ncbi:MAG: hypothetical protein M1826_006020 [Phylliscum demangeonii]|nr:MAG: hypothetical protein M1826_006020 [Phylliscum demangeonii]
MRGFGVALLSVAFSAGTFALPVANSEGDNSGNQANSNPGPKIYPAPMPKVNYGLFGESKAESEYIRPQNAASPNHRSNQDAGGANSMNNFMRKGEVDGLNHNNLLRMENHPSGPHLEGHLATDGFGTDHRSSEAFSDVKAGEAESRRLHPDRWGEIDAQRDAQRAQIAHPVTAVYKHKTHRSNPAQRFLDTLRHNPGQLLDIAVPVGGAAFLGPKMMRMVKSAQREAVPAAKWLGEEAMQVERHF